MKKYNKIFLYICLIGLLSFSIGFFVSAAEQKNTNDVKEIKTYSSVTFFSKLSELVKNQDRYIKKKSKDSRYESARIIIKTKKKMDFSNLEDVTYIISNNENRYVVQFSSSDKARIELLKLKKDQNVVYAEIDCRVKIVDKSEILLSNKENLSWGSDYIGTNEYSKYVKLKASGSAVVAIVDSGIESSHLFFKDKLVQGYDFIDNDKVPNDLDGHGTHVAGIVVDNVGGNNVKIMPLRALDAEGEGYYSIISNAINYAVEKKADVINLSLGGIHSDCIDEAVDNALKNDIPCVVAAGNEHHEIDSFCCPAHISGVISVGAIDCNGERVDYSNYGTKLDVMAPGENIRSSVLNNSYDVYSGTSMAAPHVSACIALMKIFYPTYTSKQIERLLKSTCSNYPNYEKYNGYGCVNVRKLINYKSDICLHNFVYNNYQEATCTSPGEKEYFYCSLCNKYYLDEDGIQQVDKADLVIPATGHNLSEKQLVQKAGINKKGIYVRRCLNPNCSYEQDIEYIPAVKDIILNEDKIVYTGKKCKPSVIVKDDMGRDIPSLYYSVTYGDNVNVGNGVASIVFNGIYEGSIEKNFSIVRQSLNDACLSKNLFDYSGKNNNLIVKINNKVLKENRDYYISNSINKKAVGSYDIKICGVGNYQGKKTLHYKIIPKSVKIKKIIPDEKKTRIYWSANKKEYDGFVLQYAYDNGFNNDVQKCVISNKVKAFTIFKLKYGGVVYCRVQGYKIVKGKKIYSKWSETEAFVI